MAVGKMFGKATVTRTLVGEEPMVTLDAAALTERIGTISHPAKPTESADQPIIVQAQATEPRWRSYLRARPVS